LNPLTSPLILTIWKQTFGLLLALVLFGAPPVWAQTSGFSPTSSSITSPLASSSPSAVISTVGTTTATPVLPASLPESSAETDSAHLFEIHCAGCHIHGGNIVRRGKNLKLKTLQKYHMDSVEAIAQIVSLGRGNMSAYQDRLTPDQIQILAGYVLTQAEQGWPR
jgi:cytochrome c6